MATTYSLISTTTVGSGGVGTITFSSIPATFTHLMFKGSTRCSSSTTQIDLSINGSTANMASNKTIIGTIATNVTTSTSPSAGLIIAGNNSSLSAANCFSTFTMTIARYTAAVDKTISIQSSNPNTAASGELGWSSGIWTNSSIISSVTFTPAAGNFAQYSMLSLYGITTY
jgi:hypothetical protein